MIRGEYEWPPQLPDYTFTPEDLALRSFRTLLLSVLCVFGMHTLLLLAGVVLYSPWYRPFFDAGVIVEVTDPFFSFGVVLTMFVAVFYLALFGLLFSVFYALLIRDPPRIRY